MLFRSITVKGVQNKSLRRAFLTSFRRFYTIFESGSRPLKKSNESYDPHAATGSDGPQTGRPGTDVAAHDLGHRRSGRMVRRADFSRPTLLFAPLRQDPPSPGFL